VSAKVSSCYLGNANGHFHIGNPNLASEGRSLAELVEINLNKMPVPWEEYLVLGFHELANPSCELIVLMRSEAFANLMHVTIPE
jgi:hypothetical protein